MHDVLTHLCDQTRVVVAEESCKRYWSGNLMKLSVQIYKSKGGQKISLICYHKCELTVMKVQVLLPRYSAGLRRIVILSTPRLSISRMLYPEGDDNDPESQSGIIFRNVGIY